MAGAYVCLGSNEGDTLPKLLYSLGENIGDIHLWSLLLGCLCVAILVLAKRS
jgi:hypothetical protein